MFPASINNDLKINPMNIMSTLIDSRTGYLFGGLSRFCAVFPLTRETLLGSWLN